MDIFPFIAQGELIEKEFPLNVTIDLAVHPGTCLISLADEERDDEEAGERMNDMFFDATRSFY